MKGVGGGGGGGGGGGIHGQDILRHTLFVT